MSRSLKPERMDLEQNALWKIYENELHNLREQYLGKLRTDPTISETVTKGEMWQVVHRVISLIIAYPERIVEDSTR